MELAASPTPARAIASAGEPEREDDPLAEPIGEEPPREEERGHPEREGGEHDADLGDREVEVIPQLRREDGDAHRRSGNGCLRPGPDGEHDPAVARCRHRCTACSHPTSCVEPPLPARGRAGPKTKRTEPVIPSSARAD